MSVGFDPNRVIPTALPMDGELGVEQSEEELSGQVAQAKSTNKGDRLDEIVSSFHSIDIFCEMAIQRMQLAKLYREQAHNNLTEIKSLGQKDKALTALEQCVREGITINIDTVKDPKNLDNNVKRAEAILEEALKQIENPSSDKTDADREIKVKFEQELANKRYASGTYELKDPNAFLTYLENTAPVPHELGQILKDLNIDLKPESSHNFACHWLDGMAKLPYKGEDYVGQLNPPRVDKGLIEKLKTALVSVNMIAPFANEFKDMGFTKVPTFDSDKKGQLEKEKYLANLDIKHAEVQNQMDTILVFLQDSTSQAQSCIDKGNKDLDKYEKLLGDLVRTRH